MTSILQFPSISAIIKRNLKKTLFTAYAREETKETHVEHTRDWHLVRSAVHFHTRYFASKRASWIAAA